MSILVEDNFVMLIECLELFLCIRDDLGYGGVIYEFKNFVLRGNVECLFVICVEYVDVFVVIDVFCLLFESE